MKISKITSFITGPALCAAAAIPYTNGNANLPTIIVPHFAELEESEILTPGLWIMSFGSEIYENVAKPAWLKEWSNLEYANYHPSFKYDLTKLVANGNLTETAMRWVYVTMTGNIYLNTSSPETARYKEEEADETEMRYLWATGLTHEDWCFEILEPLCEKAKNENTNFLPDACLFKNQHDVVFDFIDVLHRRPEGITDSTKEEFINFMYAYKPKA